MGKLAIMSRTAPPIPIPNLEKRSREHLFPQEVAAMVTAAKRVGRHGLRDSTLIVLGLSSRLESIGVSFSTVGTDRFHWGYNLY